MERQVVLRLEAVGCTAEATFNGVPLARVDGQRSVVTLPVNEFTLMGANELELVVHPGAPGAVAEPEPMLSDGKRGASLQLLLPRMAGVAHPASARTLVQLDWAPAVDEVYQAPASLRKSVELPIAFPRWRWLDAPVIADVAGLKKDIATYLLEIAVGLIKGNPEPLIQASRLRLEELALAYDRNLADDVARLRSQVLAWHAAQPLKPDLPAPGKMLLRPVAGGRLLECLTTDGAPMLRSPLAGGGSVTWPMRLAAVEGRFYVLR
jgi:hypothetical protein